MISCDFDFHGCHDKAFDEVDVCVGGDESLLCTRNLKTDDCSRALFLNMNGDDGLIGRMLDLRDGTSRCYKVIQRDCQK